MNFEINLIFLVKQPFYHMTLKVKTKIKYLENEKVFRVE